MKRVLVTGPTERIAEWCGAARKTGWEPIEFPLLEIAPRDIDPRSVPGLDARFDWICVTSSSAIAFLESALASNAALAKASVAVVGERSAERLERIGLAPTLEPAASAHALSVAIAGHLKPHSRILWPRGDRSDELARELRARGCEVVDPIVYETRSLGERAAPESEAVFFASPSAVAAWHEREHTAREPRLVKAPRLAIAIGPTTFEALFAETEQAFERVVTLAEATPEAFAQALAHIDPA
jgi:uroporphyrinogen-III synthase